MIVVRVKMAMILLLLMMMIGDYDDGNVHLCSMSMHWPSLQVNSPSEQVVSFIRFTCTPSKCQKVMKIKIKAKIKMSSELKRIWIWYENVWWEQNGDVLTMRIWMVIWWTIHTWLKKVIRNWVGLRSEIVYLYIFLFSPGTLQLRCGTCHPSPRRSRRRGRLQNTLTL